MSKSKEELMKPRYEVIANYPMASYAIGQIIHAQGGCASVIEGGVWSVNLSKYQAIFRPLAWWERREGSEMPEYISVKNQHSGGIEIVKTTELLGLPFSSLDKFYPATLEEYINSKKVKE